MKHYADKMAIKWSKIKKSKEIRINEIKAAKI